MTFDLCNPRRAKHTVPFEGDDDAERGGPGKRGQTIGQWWTNFQFEVDTALTGLGRVWFNRVVVSVRLVRKCRWVLAPRVFGLLLVSRKYQVDATL